MARKILIVDDELDFLKLIAKRIASWDYEVLTASSGKEAISKVKNKEADIVILDYMMPEMDGIATLRKIRKINRKIPIIMFTAYTEGDTLTEAIRSTGEAFIPKASALVDNQVSLRTVLDLIDKKLSGDH